MKKLVGLIICLSGVGLSHSHAQVRCEAYMPSFFVDVDANVGVLMQKASGGVNTANYPSLVTATSGKLSFTNGLYTSADVQFGYYIDRNRSFGIGTGIVVSQSSGTLGLDTFHAEFKAYDYKGNVFRQIVSTDHPIAETENRTSISIPILLRYKKDINPKTLFTVDAGLLYNIQSQDKWSTNANFDYEAIYHFINNGSATTYESSLVPGNEDLIWTKTAVVKQNPGVNLNNFFATRNAALYSIGLNENVNKKSGTLKPVTGSLGYTAAAAFNFKIGKKIYFRLGAYYLTQTFNNTSQANNSVLTSKIIRNVAGQDVGVDYSSLMAGTKSVQTSSYGITLGFKIYLSSRSLLDFE
jgi:hypothetical protein